MDAKEILNILKLNFLNKRKLNVQVMFKDKSGVIMLSCCRRHGQPKQENII
jgi:hypothetical protein